MRAARRSGRGDQDAGWRGASSSLCARVEKGSLLAHSRAARCRGKEWQRPFPGPSLRRCIACKVHGPDHWARSLGQSHAPGSCARVMRQGHAPESSASVPGSFQGQDVKSIGQICGTKIRRPDLWTRGPSTPWMPLVYRLHAFESHAFASAGSASGRTVTLLASAVASSLSTPRSSRDVKKRRRQPQRQGGIHRLSEARAPSA